MTGNLKRLRHAICLDHRIGVLRKPTRHINFFYRVTPVIHRSRDTNDHRSARQEIQGVLTEPKQSGVGGIKSDPPTRRI
ncbi:hypothetical protein FrEUN1fDRAFT_1208 [Parafrankia sp. EUN1f]|nr:hypothetical protein FrEUN1fDRAFT_1208 [Parafrankia sp. EUN1f]